MSPVAEYIKNVGKSVAYAAYDYTTDTMPATSEFIETNNELFSDVYHSVIDLRHTMDKGMEAVQNTPAFRQGSKAFHNAIEDIKTGKLYNSEREDSVMSESFNMDDDFNMDNLDSGSSSSEESSMTMGEKSIMSATQESANKIAHTTASVIEASTNYSVEAAKQNATMLYAQSVKTNSTLEGGFKAVTTGMEALYKFDTEVVQTMANNSKIYFETTTKIMQENNAILKEMLEMQRNLYKRDNHAKNENDPLFNIMGANGGVDIKEYAKQIFKNAKSLISDKTLGMSDMISEDMLKQFAANPLKSIPTLMISTALGPAIKTTMQNLDKTLGGMFGSFLSKMNYQASQNSWGGSLGKEIMGKLFGVQLSAKETIDTSDINSKVTPMERSVVEIIPSHLSRIEAALTGNPARVYDAKKGKWTNMAAIKSGFKKDKENAIQSAGYEETGEMKDIMNKLVENQAMNSKQVKHMEEVIQKINRKRFDDGGWLDRSGSSMDKAMRYGVSEEEWNLFEKLYSNVSRGARANTPGRFMRERLDRNRKLKNAEASSNSALRLLFNDFDPSNSLNIDSKKLQETGGTLGQNILHAKDKHGMTVFDYLRDIDLNTMYGGGGGRSRRSRRKGIDDMSFREQELANRHANGARESAAAGDNTVTTANAGNESDNSRQINDLNINQADLISAAGAVKDARREQQMKENRTFITKYINEKMATEVQKMKANGANAQEIAKYRESMKKMVDAASDGGRFGAMTEAIQHLTARPVGVITGIMEQADKHIFNTLFEEEDRDDKDEEGKPAKGFFGKLKNRLDEVFVDIKDKINKRDEEIGNTNLSLFQKANAIIKEYTGVDVRQNLQNMKKGVIDTGKSALNQVKGALEGTARDIGLESWVDKLGKKRESNTDTNNASQTSTAADGARNVTKTGLTILSKGERVIPADQNIYNPDMRKVNRADNRRDEAKIKQQLIDKVRDSNMMADGGTIDENGKAVKDNTKEKSMFAQFGERIGIWDSDNDKKITNMTQKEVEKYLPAVAGGGTAGAVIATATGLGGPLAGAIAGAAINIAANSEAFQKKLFGDRIYDETTGADTGKRKGGIFSQEMQDTMNKYLPDAKKYGITGSVLGLVTPLGPLGGLMMGGAISFLKNNDTAKNALFGENGLIGKDTAKTLRKAFPTISKTAIAGLLAGGVSGIGLIPGALVGAGIGLVSTTDEFKDFLLGTPDKDGNRVGGVAGAIKEGLVDPLKSVGRSVKDNFLDWFKVKMTKPIVDAMAPMGKQLQLGVTSVFKWGKDLAKRVASSRTGISLMNRLRYSKAGRAAGWLGGKAFGAAKDAGSIAKWAIERPSAIIGGVGDRLRKHQIKNGNADYMTAEERLKFMGDEDYDMRSFDESINGTTNEGIEEIRKKFGEIDEGKNFLEKEHNTQLKKMGNHVAKGIKDTGRAKQIIDAVRNGNMKRAVKLVESSKMSERDKSKMIEFINEEGEKLRGIAMRKDNFKADRGEMFKQLEKMGMKGLNEDNYEKYKKYFETEAAKRSKQDKANAEALDTTDPAAMQAAEINMTLKSGFDEQIPLLEKMTGYLSQMVAGQGGMTPEQAKALEGMKQTGLEAENKATKKRIRNARKTSIAIKRAFGGKKKITADNQMKLLDMKNSERKHMMRIANNGLQLDDVNKVLELKGKNKDRWFALADYGYNITDMKLISSMSNRDFNKLMILAKAGIPITNIKAISKYDEHECEIMAKLFGQGMEIAQGGLHEFARKGDMTEDEFATKKGMVNNLEGSYEERIGLNRQEGIEQFSKQRTKQSKLARMGESMKESAQDMAHATMADIGQKVYATTHGYNNRNRKSGAINNAGLAKNGTGAIKSIASSKGVDILEGITTEAAAAANPEAIRAHADGGKITKDEVAVVSKGERIESPSDFNKEKEESEQDKDQTQEPDKAQVQKKESELDKAVKETKKDTKDKPKSTSTINTEYGPQEYKVSTDGSMVVTKTKQSMEVQKRILDRDTTQKELLASIKELVATNKESLKHSIAGVGKKAKKGLFDLLKDLNPLNLLKKFGGAIASMLGPFAPLLFKGINAVGGLAKKGLGWAGGKILDKVKDVGSKVLNKTLNTKIGQKIANSKVGKFARKIGGKLFSGSTNDTDLDTSTPTNELEAIHIHGSNTEKLLTQILDAIKDNGGGSPGDKHNPVPGFDDFEPDIPGRRRRKNSGKKGKKGNTPSVPGDGSPGKKGGKKANGRLGKLLALGGGIASGLDLGNMFGGNDADEDNDENKPVPSGDDETTDNIDDKSGKGKKEDDDGIEDMVADTADGLAKKGLNWAGTKALNTKVGKKFANSKVGKFALKVGGELLDDDDSSTSDDDLGSSTPTNELEAINVHGSNTEKLLTQILEAIKGNGDDENDDNNLVSNIADFLPDALPGGRKKRGKNTKEGKNVPTPSDVSSGGKKGGKKANGRLGKLLALGGGIASGLDLGGMFGGNDTDEDTGEDVENDTGASQMDLANNNNSTMDTVDSIVDAGSTAMDIKDATDVASERSSKFANLMNKGKEAVGEAANATKENINAIVQKVESGFRTVINKCGSLLGGAAEKLTTFKDWVIKKITTPACMKKILAKAGKHAAAYGAGATGIGVVVTVGMEVGFAMSSFYDGYNDAERLLQIPAGTATTGMKLLCGFVSAALQAIPIIGWVLEPEDVMQGAVSTIGPVFGVSEDDLNKVRKVSDKASKGLSQITDKIAETAEKAKNAAGSVFSNYAGYGQNMDDPGNNGDKNQSVWDKFKGYGSELLDKAGGAASKVYNWVKDKAGSAVQGVKDMAKSAYDTAANVASGAVDAVKSGAQKAGNAVSNEYEYVKNKVKSTLGFGKFGHGKWGRGFQSQQDPSIAGQSFNVQGDTSSETVDERACAETTGVNVLSALGMPTSSNDVLDAVDFAAGRGYVAPDDGTKDTFFKDYLGQYGVQTHHINPSSAANTNNPVILMGKDKSNTPDKESKGLSNTPYGDQPHYVLGMGTDSNGNMTVVDPDTPNAAPQKYRASDVLNHSSLAIEAGMGKFNKSLGRKKWGKGPTIDENPPFGSVASAIASKTGSDHPELFWAQMMVETGGPDAERKWMQDHPEYGDICNYGGFTWYPGMGEEYKGPPRPSNEGGYYAKFKSDAEYADMAYRKVYQSYQDDIKQATNAQEFAHILKEHGYYAGDENDYAAGLQARLDEYKDQLGNLKNMSPSGASSNGSSSGGPSEFGGIFGDLADAASALSGGFSISAPSKTKPASTPSPSKTKPASTPSPSKPKGKWRFGRGKDDNNILSAAAANVDALKPKATGDLQNSDTKDDINKIVDYQTAMEYIQEVPQDQIPEYNKPNPNDSITVLRAKCKKIRENFEKQQNGKGKRKSILGRAKKAISKNPVIKAFNEYMNGRGPRVAYGTGKWGKGEGSHIWDYLKEKGLSSNAIAGIMGNMQAESSLEPNIIEGGGHADEITVGGPGYGLCQWTSQDRQQRLVNLAQSRGTSTSDTDTQLDFMLSEIDKGYGDMLQKMDGMSPYEAALLFHQEFERSNDSPQAAARRGEFAEEIAKTEGKGESFNGTYKGGGGASKKKRGLFGKLTEMATALSDKMKKAIAPMAGAITSGAEKMFGKDTISAIFGDANPFSSIFSSPSGGEKKGGGGGSFASASSDEGIRKASAYAESRVGTEGYGNNGCTTWCQVYLKQAGNPFADEMSLYVPTLMEQAKQKGIWKEPDQPGCEGDIALLETVGDRSDGPDHAVIYDGRGGCWGNSSSKNKIIHYDNMLASFPGGLWGYVATGNGGGTVATKEGEGQSAADAAADSTTDGQGKWSSKWGKGRKRPLRLSAAARARYGKGLLDNLKGQQRDPKKELEMQAKLIKDKTDDTAGDYGIKTVKDVAAYIKDIPKASIPKYNRIKKGDSIAVARAKAIKAKQMFEEQASKDPKANPSIKMMEDVSKMSLPQNTLAKDNKPAVSDPDNPLSGNDGINSIESAKQYISGLPEDYKNNIPEYNRINDDDSIMVARAKALKTMDQYKKTAKDQPQDTTQEGPDSVESSTSTTESTEGKGKWGRGFGSWLKRIGGTIGDAATGLWKGMTQSGGIFGGPAAPFLKPLNSNDATDNKKSLADEFENDIKYIMTAKEWQDKSGRNPSRAEAIEILKKDKKYQGKINDDGTLIDDTKKAENQKAADSSYTENDITYIMTAREWQDSQGRNPSRAEAEKILQEQGKSGKGKWGRGFGSWLKRIGGTIGDAATGLWKGMTQSGGIFGGPAAPFLKPLNSNNATDNKKSLADEFENDIKYIMTAKEWQGKDGRNPSRAEAIEILKKDKKYEGKINDDGTLKDESKKAENQKAADKIDTSYNENDITYIMTAREWQDSEGRNPSRAEAEKILQEQAKSGKGKWGRRRHRKESPLVEQKKPSFLERITSILNSSNNYAKFADDHGIRTMQDALDYVKDIPADFQAKYPDNIINPDAANGDSIEVARAKAIKMRELWEQENSNEAKQATQPVNAVMRNNLPQAPSIDIAPTDDTTNMSPMDKILDSIKDIPEDFIAKYPYNRIDPANDSLTVAKAKADALRKLYDSQPAVGMGKWGKQFHRKQIKPVTQPVNTVMPHSQHGRGLGAWLKRIGGSIGDVATQMWHNFTGQNKPAQPTVPEKKEKSKEEILENDIRYIMTAKEWQGKDGRNPSRAEAIAILNKDKKYNDSIDKDGKLIEKKTANDVAKEAVKNPGTLKTPTITKPEDIKTVDDAFNYISDIPDSFIEKYPYNKIDPEKDDLGVVKAKAIKLRKLYDDELAKTGTTKMESKMAAQTIDPNKPAETNTTEKNAQKTAEKASIVEKKEETKETSAPTKANDAASNDSGIKAPNGKNYSNNDINYLVKQGYTKDAAIELLSKDKKYAAATPTTTKTSDTNSADNSNATGTGEYNDKFDTMINLLASIAQSVAVIAGTPAPQIAGAATTGGTKNTTALQQSTDAKAQANRKAAAQVNSQNMQDMFAGIASAMQKLARG